MRKRGCIDTSKTSHVTRPFQTSIADSHIFHTNMSNAAVESDGLRNRFGAEAETSPAGGLQEVVETPADDKVDLAAFEQQKNRFITLAREIIKDHGDTCDLLLIIRTKLDGDSYPKIKSLATKQLKPVLSDPECQNLIAELLNSDNYDKASCHSENTTVNTKSHFGNCVTELMEEAAELSSIKGVELLCVATQKAEMDRSDYQSLHIFSTGMFRPLVVEGSPGREKIIQEVSKPREESPYAWLMDYFLIALAISLVLFFIYIMYQNIMTFIRMFSYRPVIEG